MHPLFRFSEYDVLRQVYRQTDWQATYCLVGIFLLNEKENKKVWTERLAKLLDSPET